MQAQESKTGRFSARVGIKTYSAEETTHSHPFHQVVVPWRGTLDMDVEGRAGRVQSGRLALVAGGNSHSFVSAGDNRFLVLDCGDLEVQDDSLHRLWDRATRRPFDRIHPNVWSLCRAAEPFMDDTVMRADGLSRHFVGMFLSALAESTGGGGDKRPQRVQAALDYMHAHYGEKIRMSDLAAHVNLSVSRFHALFREVTGQTAHATLRRIRLDHARRLLTGTGLSIAEIAYRTGFSDQSALTRAMRDTVGVGPGGYRKLHLTCD